MAEILNQTFLTASTATATGDTLNCWGLEQLFVEIQLVNATAINGTIDFCGGIEDVATLPTVLNGALISNGSTGGYTYNAATGRLTLTAVAGPNSRILLRFDKPTRLMRPIWTYGSGGGSPCTIRCVAWGFQVRTTP